jgi:hypothetical protein
MRALFRITLTLLIALPIMLGWAAFLTLELLRGEGPAHEGDEDLSSERAGLGPERPAT